MTQVQIDNLIEEAFKMEGENRDNWKIDFDGEDIENSGTDFRVRITLNHLGTRDVATFTLLAPRSLGATKEDFINGVRERIRLIKGRVSNG